jgi:hypothetical protein
MTKVNPRLARAVPELRRRLRAFYVSCAVPVLLLIPACSRPVRAASAPDLQAMLNSAKPGETIVLPAGSVFTGNFILPNKSGAAPITITSSEASALPEGSRVRPADRVHMAAIRSTNNMAALATAPGAHNYRLVGLEIYADHVYSYGVVQFGMNENSQDKLPSHIEVDRSYIHGDPALGSKRGIALNGIDITVRNSYISDFKSRDQDTQAICGWNGPGPYQILNNYLEGSGENIMFGGGTGAIPGVVPSDIEIRGNYIVKPFSWKPGTPSFAGTPWMVKNLLELKAARRVHIAGNILENNWVSGQSGHALAFTVRTENGAAPWYVLEDVTFENNWVRNVVAGVNVLGTDGPGHTRRVTFRNNIWNVDEMAIQLLSGAEDITFDHNTIVNGQSPVSLDGPPCQRVSIVNNIMWNIRYGIHGSGIAQGKPSIEHYLPGAQIKRNVIIGADPDEYPRDNFFPESAKKVMFVDFEEGNYKLGPKSRYRNAGTDGRDIGADIDAVRQATANCIVGRQLVP